MDHFATVDIEFNTIMKTDFNFSMINETVLDIYVQPSNDRHLDDDTFDANHTLNLTNWKVHNFQNRTLTLNMTFIYPYQISPKLELDNLIIFIKDMKYLFISKEYL
jgi:hypothetical protein